jgi:hypothetical protein
MSTGFNITYRPVLQEAEIPNLNQRKVTLEVCLPLMVKPTSETHYIDL